jgi:hypothetical protein
MNIYWSTALTNIFICLAVIGGLFITKSPWRLWGLIFIYGIKFGSENEKVEENGNGEVEEVPNDQG